eukprot:4005059-Pyramimonas_sp.AAC.1
MLRRAIARDFRIAAGLSPRRCVTVSLLHCILVLRQAWYALVRITVLTCLRQWRLESTLQALRCTQWIY